MANNNPLDDAACEALIKNHLVDDKEYDEFMIQDAAETLSAIIRVGNLGPGVDAHLAAHTLAKVIQSFPDEPNLFDRYDPANFLKSAAFCQGIVQSNVAAVQANFKDAYVDDMRPMMQAIDRYGSRYAPSRSADGC